MALEYRQTTDPCGIEVLDPIAQVSLELSTSTNQLFPGPEDLPFSEFVADTFEVETTYVDINHGVFLPFYDEEMNFIQWFVEHQQGSLPFGTYIVNTTAVIKCYLLFTGAPTVTVSPDRARIEFDDARRVVLGCRSEHSNPDVEWEAVVLDPGVTPKYALPAERLPEVVMGFGSGDRGPPVRMNGRLHWPNSEAAVEQLLDR
ncbi:hypothetical protein [Haloarchaeobius sp. DYHT-AS-18]|uniref:hypothetical protein n=1 Tax=Haloarchaeobius sp. DYHT-AS-18 TaxID=3446117 RepID=UPI003EBF70E8